MKTGIVLLLAVIATHYGYQAAGAPQTAENVFYVLRGLEGALLFYFLATARVGGAIGLIACYLGMFEEAQTAACGMLYVESVPVYSGICLEQFGPWPYAIVAATALVYLTCLKNTTKQPSQPHQ